MNEQLESETIRQLVIAECASALESDLVLGRAMGGLAANVVRSLGIKRPPVGLDWTLSGDAKRESRSD